MVLQKLAVFLILISSIFVFGEKPTGDKSATNMKGKQHVCNISILTRTSGHTETCEHEELCRENVRVLTGIFSSLEVNQALICSVAGLVASATVLLLLLFLLLSRLSTTLRRE